MPARGQKSYYYGVGRFREGETQGGQSLCGKAVAHHWKISNTAYGLRKRIDRLVGEAAECGAWTSNRTKVNAVRGT